MSNLICEGKKGSRHLLMGNEAIARGALEAGVCVAAGYPGTPSSDIIEVLGEVSKQRKLYVEWSVNEKVAMEVAAAASFAGLRSLCVMKQNGVNVASDFLLHLAYSGIRAGMVLVPCDDPGAHSSANEGESRHFAKMVEIPLLEPGDFQEAKDMIKWAFELSEELGTLVMVRSVTRLSHASGNVIFDALPEPTTTAHFKHNGAFIDPLEGPMVTLPVIWRHSRMQQKLQQAAAKFEESPFNIYSGPENPELLIITSSAGALYSREAVDLLKLGDRVGLLKLGTTWPLPAGLLETYLGRTDQILIVEEVISFLEDNVKILAAELASKIGIKTFFGKKDGAIPMAGELNPDLVVTAVSKILGINYEPVPESYENRATEFADRGAPGRDLTFCPGCPHRASFWTIHNVLQMDKREGFVCGDIGCYSLAMLPCGFETLKSLHAMGSGAGLASGFGKLKMFGMDQPVMAAVGDSTFFHAVLPALINAVHHQSDITLVVLDNSGTAMTGFQPHPGLPVDVKGDQAPEIDIVSVCEAIGARVKVCDPFDLQHTQQTLFELLEDKGGVKVLVLKQICALSPEKKSKKMYEVEIDEAICLGENCGCNRLCTRVFKCPGLIWDHQKAVSTIDEVICAGCGVCASICPAGAISKKEVA
ncbi:MAG: thiamine pyrophosphate-dependent enzyme [Desulfobacterales bacterium]|jgi:indolepyruvate ferredoxin oxidoreductase alpha subunit